MNARSVVVVLSALLLRGAVFAGEPAAKTTLKGQVVCSRCYAEEDRAKVPYGSADDLDCAKRCAKRNVPMALAVGTGKDVKLVVLASADPHAKAEAWLPHVGKNVTVKGSVEKTKDGERIVVDTLEADPAK